MKALCLLIILLTTALCKWRKIAVNHSKHNIISILNWGTVELTAKFGDYWVLDLELHKDYETEIGDILDTECSKLTRSDSVKIVLLRTHEDSSKDDAYFNMLFPQVFPRAKGDKTTIRCIDNSATTYETEFDEFAELAYGFARRNRWESLALKIDE
jgi:hypothetical protein